MKTSSHVRIDASFLAEYQAKIGAAALSVYVFLLSRMDGETSQCYPRFEAITEGCGLSKPTVIKAVKTLTEHGIISVENRTERGKQSSNLYAVLIRHRVKNIDSVLRVKNIDSVLRVKNIDSIYNTISTVPKIGTGTVLISNGTELENSTVQISTVQELEKKEFIKDSLLSNSKLGTNLGTTEGFADSVRSGTNSGDSVRSGTDSEEEPKRPLPPPPSPLYYALCSGCNIDPLHHAQKTEEGLRFCADHLGQMSVSPEQVAIFSRRWKHANDGRWPIPANVLDYWPRLMRSAKPKSARTEEPKGSQYESVLASLRERIAAKQQQQHGGERR